MKYSINTAFFKNAFLIVFLSITAAISYAQDSVTSAVSTTASSTTETTMWYAEPWVWVVGGAILILLIVALTRGGGSTPTGRTDQVTVTKTTTTDTI